MSEASKPGTDIDLFNGFFSQDYADGASFLRAELTNVIPAVSFPAGSTTAYLGPSLGCRVFPPYGYGLDLAALSA